MLRFEDVTYRYTEEAPDALREVSITVNAGEAVAVMGANGSGKSTFARLAANLHEPTKGWVKVTDRQGRDTPVGILFQNPDNQMVAVTVEKEIAFALENLATPLDEMEERITDTLERFGITHLRRRLTAELSGGEKQRVALASVMIAEPEVLVLDEPDSYLDQAGKIALREELAALRDNNRSMIQIHITQYPQVAKEYSRLIVFHEGKIAADSRPEKIFADEAFCRQTGLRYDIDQEAREVAAEADVLKTTERKIHQIELDGATVGYPGSGFTLPELDLSVKAGEVIGVVGPSGSGKSTLGLLLCRLLKPTRGRVLYLGPEGGPANLEDILGRVTAIFQQPERQFFLPTCAQEIEFGPRNIGRALTITQTQQMLRLVGLDPTEFTTRDPFRLSGGEKRRLAFAAVLSMRPDMVVFDEPTCALDPEGVGRFIRLAKELRESGAGVVVISHDGEVIRALSDRVLVLDGDGSCRVGGASAFFGWEGAKRLVSG